MIQFDIRGTFTPEFLERVRNWAQADPLKLAEACRDILVEGNRAGLLAGTDAQGVAMAELKESTIRRGRGGFGPPTVPRYSGSQLVDRFQVQVARDGVKGYRLRAGWPGVPQVRYFHTGTRHMARRDPAGVRPDDQKKMRQAAREYAESLLKGDG